MSSSGIGIKGLITKNVKEMEDLVKIFIKSSLNIRDGIIQGEDPEICMLSLIRDTYICNLILRYVGLMTLVNHDPKWNDIDNRLIGYVHKYYMSEKFKNKLIELYEHYLNIFENTKTNYDYCIFLDKMISRGEISKNGNELKKIIRMFENKIFNTLNINSIVKINKRYFKSIPTQFEVTDDKVVVNLTQTNYYTLLDTLDDPNVLYQLENQYMICTNNILGDFSKLIVARQILAEETHHDTYFKYINKGKSDNSETIKDFLNELNNKLDLKIKTDVLKIYQNFLIGNKYNTNNNNNPKMKRCDIIKYIRSKKNDTLFDPIHVVHVIFGVLEKFFNITSEKIDEKGWNKNVTVYCMRDTNNKKILGRLFMDIFFDENKRISDPISIRLSDKMHINTNPNDNSPSEVALIANYLPYKYNTIGRTSHNGITYSEVVLLFREFGYIISNVCYESRVGLVNYDEEFSNYIPSLMECISWDHDIISKIVADRDTSIVDHIEMDREMDMCYNIKTKCANAKFDHLIHNSEPLLKIITQALDTKGDANNEILETYKNIFKEVMEPISDIFETNINKIDPNVVIQEINSSQAVMYSNLMNEIFAYATYWIIKNKSVNNKNIVTEFRKTILDNGVDNYRELIRIFLKKSEINCFSLYVTNVIKTNMIDEYVTEDTNYFEDNEDSVNDEEDIIQFNRL
jgi:Zn-dependent oligopeptidase